MTASASKIHLPAPVNYVLCVGIAFHAVAATEAAPDPANGNLLAWRTLFPLVAGILFARSLWSRDSCDAHRRWRKTPGIVILQYLRYCCRHLPVGQRLRTELYRIRRNAAAHSAWPADVLAAWTLATGLVSLLAVFCGSVISRLFRLP